MHIYQLRIAQIILGTRRLRLPLLHIHLPGGPPLSMSGKGDRRLLHPRMKRKLKYRTEFPEESRIPALMARARSLLRELLLLRDLRPSMGEPSSLMSWVSERTRRICWPRGSSWT